MKLLNNCFKIKFQELTVNDIDVHNYLGLTVGFTHPKERCVKLTMYNFLNDILMGVDKKGDMVEQSITQAAENLFTVIETL